MADISLKVTQLKDQQTQLDRKINQQLVLNVDSLTLTG